VTPSSGRSGSSPHWRASTVIEDQLDAIDRQYDAVLPLLKTTSATTREGLLARLDALLWLLNPHDNEDAYPLLQSCQDDLKRLWR